MSKATQRWDWAIGLDPNNLTDAHLQQAYKLNWDNLCKFDSCRKNCKRILCLACFDKSWIDSADNGDSYEDSLDASKCELKRTDLGTFAGLKNLGATCYVNCLLQLWFHNPALRKAIYAWQKNGSLLGDQVRPRLMPSEQGDTATAIVPYEDQDRLAASGTPSKRPRLTIKDPVSPPDEVKKSTTSTTSTYSNSETSGSKTNGNDVAIDQKRTESLPESTSGSTTKTSIKQHPDNNNKTTGSNHVERGHNSANATTTAPTTTTATTTTTTTTTISTTATPVTANTAPTDPIEQLQLIFARLQFTNKKSIDPSDFIESLALNAAEQQDAQEFGNLFIEFLEKSFATQKNKFVANIIKNQFLGKYSYATICDHCKHSSVSDSNFYELDLSIQNLDTLHECLNEYFRPVPLDGKYNCSQCQRAQSAHRKIILKSVPPTLNLQLLRFVYDKQKNARQKLNSFIVFPEILDMTPYLQERANNIRIRLNPFDLSACNVRNRSNIYILTAVLIHRGSSPHSGHYIAHIKDRVTKDWYKFNDEHVERIGPQLQVSTEGETISIVDDRSENIKFNDPAFGKLIKMESKSLKSKTAYMLVYQAHDNEALTYPSDHSAKWELPDHLQCAVAKENSECEELFRGLQWAREFNQQVMETRKTQIRTIYNNLVIRDPSDKFEFIDKNWLANWLSNSSRSAKILPIDNSHLLCIHDKLDFRKIDQVKCVRPEGLDMLYEEFGGGPRLKDAMCRECVELEVKLIQLKERMKEEQKFITSQAKFKLDDYDWFDAYIVGRNSYRDWQALVMCQFEKQHPELVARKRDSSSNGGHNQHHHSSDEEAATAEPKPASANSNNIAADSSSAAAATVAAAEDSGSSDSDDDAIERFVFNSDTQCEHGQLIGDTNAWRIVPREVWAIFKRYFGNDSERPLIELNANTLMCPECKQQEAAQQEKGDNQKRIALEQKSKLADLFHMRKRATWEFGLGGTMLPGDEFYALDRQFLLKWQKWLRNPCNQEKPSAIVHEGKLTCAAHKLALYNADNSNPVSADCPFVLVSKQELADLRQFYPLDHEIKFFVDPKRVEVKMTAHKAAAASTEAAKASQKAASAANPAASTTAKLHIPEVQVNELYARVHAMLASVDANMAAWSQATTPTISPAAAAGAAAPTPENSQNSSASGGVGARAKSWICNSDIDWRDSVISEPGYCGECHELMKQDELRRLLNYESATIYINRSEKFRPNRRNRSRDHAYTIKPKQTLLELKKEIFARYHVLPVDQRLFLDDKMLDDNTKTMTELMIVPNCSLRLEIDQPANDTVDLIEDEPTSRKSCAQPETGFKGSLLLSNNHF